MDDCKIDGYIIVYDDIRHLYHGSVIAKEKKRRMGYEIGEGGSIWKKQLHVQTIWVFIREGAQGKYLALLEKLMPLQWCTFKNKYFNKISVFFFCLIYLFIGFMITNCISVIYNCNTCTCRYIVTPNI